MSDTQSVYKLIALEVQQQLAELNLTDPDSAIFTGGSKKVKITSKQNLTFMRYSRYYYKLSYEHL